MRNNEKKTRKKKEKKTRDREQKKEAPRTSTQKNTQPKQRKFNGSRTDPGVYCKTAHHFRVARCSASFGSRVDASSLWSIEEGDVDQVRVRRVATVEDGLEERRETSPGSTKGLGGCWVGKLGWNCCSASRIPTGSKKVGRTKFLPSRLLDAQRPAISAQSARSLSPLSLHCWNRCRHWFLSRRLSQSIRARAHAIGMLAVFHFHCRVRARRGEWQQWHQQFRQWFRFQFDHCTSPVS